MILPALLLRASGRVLALTLVVAAALTLSPDVAGASNRPTSYCSPSGDYCTETDVKNGFRRLRIGSLSFSGRYQLCVTGPQDIRQCKRFRMTENQNGLYGDSVRWRRQFSFQGPGAYRVSWHKFGSRLGPVLGFHVRS